MSGKKKPAGKQIALCLLLTAAVDGLGVLLVTLLAVKGIVGEDRVPQALGALAFCAAFAGGLPAGKGRLGPGGSLLNAGAFALLLLLLCFGGWGEGFFRSGSASTFDFLISFLSAWLSSVLPRLLLWRRKASARSAVSFFSSWSAPPF